MTFTRESIRSRLTIGTTAVVFTVGLVLGGATYLLLGANLSTAARNFAEHEAHELGAVVASAKTADEFPARHEAFRGLFPEEGVLALEVWSLTGDLVHRLPNDGPDPGRWDAGLEAAQRGEKPVEDVALPTEKRAVRAALLVSFGREPRWVAVAYVSRRRQDDALTRFLQVYAPCLLVLTLLSLLGSMFLVSRALEPVHALVRDAQAIASEGPSKRLEPPPLGSELAELAHLLNAMLERTQETIARLRTFTAHAGHELRTPLTRMHAEVEAALLKQDPALAQRALESVLEEIDVQRRVLDGLLSLSRDLDPLDLPREPVVSLSELFTEIAFEANEVSSSQQIVVEREVEPGLEVRGNRALLARILWNLIDNALHLSPAPRKVIVRVRREGDTIVVEVEDDGPGLPSDPEHLFVPFGAAPTPSTTHTGLGLPLSRGIARRHGGDLTACAAKTLSGAAFRLTLPAAGASAAD